MPAPVTVSRYSKKLKKKMTMKTLARAWKRGDGRLRGKVNRPKISPVMKRRTMTMKMGRFALRRTTKSWRTSFSGGTKAFKAARRREKTRIPRKVEKTVQMMDLRLQK